MRRILSRLPPVVVLLACLIAGFAAAQRTTAPTDGQWAALLASAVLLIAGGTLIIQAAREFRRYRTTIWPHGGPTHLLQTGPFRWSRNPVYLGMLLLAVIPFAWTGEPVALVAVAAFFGFMNGITIPVEEARLQLAFPAEFPPYCRSVRRWL